MPSASYEQLGTHLVTTGGTTAITMSFSGSAYTNYVFIAYCQVSTQNNALYGNFNGNSTSTAWQQLFAYGASSSTPPAAIKGDNSNYFYAGYEAVPGFDIAPNAFGTYRMIGSNIGQSNMTLMADGFGVTSLTAIPTYSWVKNCWQVAGTKTSITWRNGNGFSIGSRFSIYGMA